MTISEGDVDLLASDEYWDPHAIAGLLKTFLRELPASILTRDLHLRFLSVIGVSYFSLLHASLGLTGPVCSRLRGSPRKDSRAFSSDICIAHRQLQPSPRAHRTSDSHRSEREHQ